MKTGQRSIRYWMDRDHAANLKSIFGHNPAKHFLGNPVLQELGLTIGHCQLKYIYLKWDYRAFAVVTDVKMEGKNPHTDSVTLMLWRDRNFIN